MKNLLILCVLGLMAFRCGSSPDPEPDRSFFMNAWVEYTTSPVLLQLRGAVFRMPTGPVERSFDKADVYVSEGQPGNWQLLASTTQKTVPLTSLKPGVTYYLAVRGTTGSITSELSKPIRVVPDVLLPTRQLLPYDRLSQYIVSPSGQQAIRQFRDASGKTGTQLIELATGNSRTISYAATEKEVFWCRNWTSDGGQVLFEIVRSGKRALVRYATGTGQFADVKLPADADMWNFALAPDGQQVVFSDYKRPGLWYYDGRVDVQKQIDGQQVVYNLSWSADSRLVLLTTPVQGLPVIVQYDTQAGVQTTAFSGVEPISNAQLSPNKRYFLFLSTISGQSALWLQDRQTGSLRPVGNGSQFGWLSDNTFWTDYRPIDGMAETGDRTSFLWVVNL